jgi:hypothetical protein
MSGKLLPPPFTTGNLSDMQVLLYLTRNGSFFLTLVHISSPSTLHSSGASICYTLFELGGQHICGHITCTSATFSYVIIGVPSGNC